MAFRVSTSAALCHKQGVSVDIPIHEPLLRWYDAHARALPWRTANPDPYRVWLSEIMLQQTTVAAATPYFERFVARWPTVAAFADADDADIMNAWAGLGYYARARNMLKCARVIIADHGGAFPDSEAALRTLPGIGRYTAAAIAAIAFGQRAVVVDGNIERVVARLFAVETPLPAAKAELYALTDTITPTARCGDFAQALMDLGSSLCTPRRAACDLCPLHTSCAARGGGATTYPRRTPKADTPDRFGTAVWIEQDDRIWLVRRPDTGLLGGMLGFPGSAWTTTPVGRPDGESLGMIVHVFTHFRLTLTIVAAEPGCVLPPGGEWCAIDRLNEAGLPSVFAKVVNAVREGRRQCNLL
jgi:A/G-specific adenine glycosylase